MIITISGKAGSGKSTIAKIIAKKLRLKHYSSGDFMRKIAEEHKLTLIELSKLAETKKWVDKELDNRQIKLGKKEDDFIIDGRLSWHFIPKSIKIYLDVTPEIAAKRIYSDKENRSSEGFTTFKDLIKKIKQRTNSEKKRYKQYYNLDYHNKKHYDLVIDTSKVDIDNVVKKIIDFTKNKK